MTDQTQDPAKSSEASGSPVQETIRNVKRRLSDVTNLLRQQREMLRQRGVNLPSGALDSLRTLGQNVDRLNTATVGSLTELRSLRALANNAALINSSQTTGEVLNQVMDTVIALTGAERGYIVLRDKATGELEFAVARGMEQAQLDSSKGGLIISRSIVNRVADTGGALLTDNASQDTQFSGSESVANFSLRSIMAVPLKLRDEVIGVVYCDNRFFVGLFKNDTLDLLNAFAGQAAVAIENARLFEAARQSLQQVSELRDRMGNIFTSIASGIITTDYDGRIIISNAAAQTILEKADLRGQMLTDVLPVLDASFTSAYQTALTQGTLKQLVIETELNGHGTRHWNVHVSPLRDEASGILGVALVLDDVTEQRKRESQLAEVRRYLPLALVENIKNVEEIDVRGQERDVTALFADVRGFTSFSEKLQPEELMTVINKYLSIASDAINLYEGIVDKYMGDAVTGLYNTQLNPQPDHAARAVQSALALVMDLYAQHEVMPENERLYYGIGVHTGHAVLGNVGGKERKEFAAMGEATVICKYLQEQAGPGEIMISAATYEVVKDLFECELQDEVKRPKEGYEEVVFYRVLKRKKGGLSPFVDQELLDLLGEDFSA
jgi:adenylate cyclase